MLAYITGTVDQELLLRKEYLAAENRILRAQIQGRLLLSDAEKATLAEHELRQYAKYRNWTVQRVYTDHGFSGASEKRPALDELLRDTRKKKFDVVLVWKFDRFARSLRQLVSALELFRKFGIDFVSATEAIDTSLPSGELVFQYGKILRRELRKLL
jgi:DNA invertase Pin-like site-specific DNA recombinase